MKEWLFEEVKMTLTMPIVGWLMLLVYVCLMLAYCGYRFIQALMGA